MLEKDLQAKILKFLESRNEVFSFKIKQANRIGIPDIFFTTVKTGPWFVEIKPENEEPWIHQCAIIDKLNKCGTKAIHPSHPDIHVARIPHLFNLSIIAY